MEEPDNPANALLKLLNDKSEAEAGGGSVDSSVLEELLAAVRNQRGPRRPTRVRAGDSPTGGPRKCPNCGKEHPERKCPHPPVPVNKRLCWFCQGEGHVAAKCPKKAGSIKNLEPSAEPPPKVVFAVDQEGYTRMGKTGKPRPHRATLLDFVDKDLFSGIKALSVDESDETSHW